MWVDLLGTGARGRNRHDIAHRLHAFYDWCATVNIPAVTTLAETIDRWWAAVLVFLQTGITNAGTEGTNLLVKHVTRSTYGFRSKSHYRDRVRLHCTRPPAPGVSENDPADRSKLKSQ